MIKFSHKFADPLPSAVKVEQFLKYCHFLDPNCYYRGQGSIKWKLIPSAFRDTRGLPLDLSRRESVIRYFSSKDFVEDFNYMRRVINERDHVFHTNAEASNINAIQKIAFMQHFGIQTPFLDWTSSPLIALFMAFNSRDQKINKISIYKLNVNDLPDELKFQPYNKIGFRRIERQLGGITFFGDISSSTSSDLGLRISPTIFDDYRSIAPSSATRLDPKWKFISRIDIELQKQDIFFLGKIFDINGLRAIDLFPDNESHAAEIIRSKIRSLR